MSHAFDPVFWHALARTLPAIALTLAVAIAYPLLGWRRFRRIQMLPEPLPTLAKLRLYAGVVVSQWTLVAAAWVVLRWAGLDLSAVGQQAGRSAGATALTAAALLAAFGLLSVVTLRQLARARPDQLPEHVRRAGKILPLNARERAGFVAVALTAGVCEEILYRGWLPSSLAGWTGSPLLALILSALVFGVGHAYQGRQGVILTALLGLGLGVVVYFTGSLLPAQLLHVTVDLVNGVAVGAALSRGAAAPEWGGVDAPAGPPA
jgi:membrane protease YdiL (CAAX protease family)